jgi:apolipoprotein N-acyltransferase
VIDVQTAPSPTPAQRKPQPRLLSGVLYALLSGAALLVAFPLYGLWWAAPIGVAALGLAVDGRRLRAGAGLGLIAGLVFFAPLLSWTNLHVGYAPWVILSLFQASYFVLLGMALAWTSPLSKRWWPLTIALLWVAQEALRDRVPFGGFPWGRLAFSQGDSPALAFASLGGAPLVTFVTALAGGLLAAAARHLLTRRESGSATGAGTAAGAGPDVRQGFALLAGAVAVMAVGLIVPLSQPAGDPVVVAIVQGNVPRMGLDFNAQRTEVLKNHIRATLQLAEDVKAGKAKQPDLVVWPENASDIDPLRDLGAAADIDDAAVAIKAPILVGAVLSGPGDNESRNAGIVWVPNQGPAGMYLKRHPVPFAEYMPMRPLIEPIAKAITNKAKLLRTDFVAGTVPGVLDLAGTKVGDVICFEVAYDEVVRDVVTSGAELIAVQTNNATFDESEASQQLAMVRLRAVEHGRDALMASTVGISAFVAADGSVDQPTRFNTPAVIVRELHPGSSTTLATRLGMWPEVFLTALAVAALILTATRRRRVK